jgi:hypothetical protein
MNLESSVLDVLENTERITLYRSNGTELERVVGKWAEW